MKEPSSSGIEPSRRASESLVKGNPVPDAYVFFVFLHVNGETRT
jgi:hypothetical protein